MVSYEREDEEEVACMRKVGVYWRKKAEDRESEMRRYSMQYTPSLWPLPSIPLSLPSGPSQPVFPAISRSSIGHVEDISAAGLPSVSTTHQ